jgi:hypothetical protein
MKYCGDVTLCRPVNGYESFEVITLSRNVATYLPVYTATPL